MKIREYFENRLVENGLFDNQAKVIMDSVISDDASKPMSGRWNDDVEGYPVQLFAAVWYSVKRHALAWIDKNLPNAWYRTQFLN